MAKCDQKILNGIFGVGAKLGLDHEDLRAMTTTGSLRLVPQEEARELFRKLQIQLDAAQEHPHRGPWRLYSSSSLCREIEKYGREIHWESPDGFRSWLRNYFAIDDLRFVSSFQQATAIKNALKRMANSNHG